MKIILSPAKTMKPTSYKTGTTPIYDKEAKQIRAQLIEDPNLYKIYGYDEKKTDVIKEKMKQNDVYQAIHYYNGTVFKQIHSSHIDDLYILDAMYGILRPTDLISYYRLDYLMKPDLVAFWKDKVNHILSKEDCIINLASKEFSKMIEHPHMINIDFILVKNNKVTRPSMIIKKCRGAFIHELLEGKNIKEIVVEGFIYNEELSNQNNYVYQKVI